jgi:hypothetical protein
MYCKHTYTWLVIMAIYVDDLNLIGMADVISQIGFQPKGELEMKDLGETIFCLGLQVECVVGGISLEFKYIWIYA